MEEVQITHWLKMAKTLVPNERFGAMAGVMIIHATVFRTTVSGSLKRCAVEPPLRQAARTLCVSGRQYCPEKYVSRKECVL